MNPIPIIDTHQHLWDLGAMMPDWIQEGSPLAQSHTMSRYLAEAQNLNVVGTIYMEVDMEPALRSAEADYVIDLCAANDNPMLAATIGGRPNGTGFETYLEKYAASPYVKGIRQVLHGGITSDEYLSDAFVQGCRQIGTLGLHFDLCLRPTEIWAGTELIDRCPNTRFVLDHCGNGDVQNGDRTVWEEQITKMAERENVICKISGIVAGARDGGWAADDLMPVILHCVQSFGMDRILFGSDWPVCTLRSSHARWVEALLQIISDWTDTDKRKLLYQNASRFYDVSIC